MLRAAGVLREEARGVERAVRRVKVRAVAAMMCEVRRQVRVRVNSECQLDISGCEEVAEATRRCGGLTSMLSLLQERKKESRRATIANLMPQSDSTIAGVRPTFCKRMSTSLLHTLIPVLLSQDPNAHDACTFFLRLTPTSFGTFLVILSVFTTLFALALDVDDDMTGFGTR